MKNEITTIPQMFLNSVNKLGDRVALKYKKDGVWHDVSYNDWKKQVMDTAKGLYDDVKPKEMVALLSENRPEWSYADLAIVSLGAVCVPIYATNPPKDIAYILNDCEAKIIFTSNEAQNKKIKEILDQGKAKKLKKVICFEENSLTDGKTFITLADLQQSGKDKTDDVILGRMDQIDKNDLFTLIYTSGTTGEPKGVMLTHWNMISNVLDCAEGLPICEDDVAVSFLPLSHSLERMAGYYSLMNFGAVIAYAESIDKLVDNIGEVKPTILISVPRIYEKVYSRVQEGASSGLKKTIFNWALTTGREVLKYKFAKQPVPGFLSAKYGVADKLVFSKLKERLGGRIKYTVSGGAPLAREIAEFMFAAGINVMEGYGLSETSPVLTMNRPDDARLGSVGKPVPSVEIKIAPEPDREKDGEILARGPNVMIGYYKKDEETKEVLEEDKWFHTGDIGYIDEDGFLFITDRKKELLKTSGGKYVAPAPIENQLKLSPFIEQAVVIGNNKKYCTALLAPNTESLQNWAKDNAISFTDMQDLVNNPKIQNLFQKEIDRVNAPLGRWEQIKYFKVLPNEFTQETGELTPTLKLKRRIIDQKYKDLIEAMYQEA